MNIPKKLVEQWLQEAPADSDTAISTHIAQRAAEWALQQPVSMEPVAFVCAPSDSSPISMTCPVKSLDILTTMHNAPLYSQSQLAAARQQGADEERKRCTALAEELHDTLVQRIAELEKSNAVLLEALQDICDLSKHEAKGIARAAIAEVKP